MQNSKQRIVVTCALITTEHTVFCARRSQYQDQSGLWELPGGKQEMDESLEACLQRELKEELGIDAQIGAEFSVNCHEYVDKIIELHAFWVTSVSGEFKAHEHEAIDWQPKSQLSKLDWAAADIPFIHSLMKLESKTWCVTRHT